jgi:farnesyl-diphosphate farnesyltransferase
MNEKEILRRTSRSFYLTLALLPRTMREEASLAYLLARATDTLADASSLDTPRRLEALRSVRDSLGRADLRLAAADLLEDGAVGHAAERALLDSLPRLWREMYERNPASRQRLETLLGHILEGQIFDLERFGHGSPPLSWQELDLYTYMVAGSVGEFWTDLCAEKPRAFSRESFSAMRARGKCYGKGLQLVNVLRDRRADEAEGRIYVAQEAVGNCFTVARAWLEEGARYCVALRNGRLRYASLLPCVLGLRTLALVAKETSKAPRPVKITRGEVRYWMLRSMPVWVSRGAVRRVVREASADQSHCDSGKNERAAEGAKTPGATIQHAVGHAEMPRNNPQ